MGGTNGVTGRAGEEATGWGRDTRHFTAGDPWSTGAGGKRERGKAKKVIEALEEATKGESDRPKRTDPLS